MKELLAQGYDQEQILAYFENSYGEFVRLEPPLRGVNWLVWLGPLLALAGRWRDRHGDAARRAAASQPGKRQRRCPGPGTLPDDPELARHVRRVRELAYGWPDGRPTRERRLMPPSEVQWQPALVVLVSGLVLGALLVWWVRRRGGPAAAVTPEAPSLELRDLDGRVAVLLRQLRELDDAATKRTPEQLARERYALELEAARALAGAGGARAHARGAHCQAC